MRTPPVVYKSTAPAKTRDIRRLAQFGGEKLVSRSQAKRVLSRFEKFDEALLDFQGVDFIGQAFADEIFRVFPKGHPDVKLVWANANEDVTRMIALALTGAAQGQKTLF